MIVDPDFCDHWKVRMLVGLLDGDEVAPVYVLRLWAHCQNRRKASFENLPTEAIKALCRYNGDATRFDLLESAGAEDAKIFVSAIDDAATNEALVETLKKHFPHLKLMMRTRHRYDAYELIDHGVQHVYRDHIDTSVRLGVDVLRTLGMRSYSAVRAGQNFFKFDEAALPNLAKQRHDFKTYIASVRAEIEHQEELLKNDFNFSPNDNDHAWDSEHMRETIQKST